MDHLDGMRVFVTVAKLGSFAEAARRLRLSPSAVTRAVAQLEARLDQTVLARTTRTVRLTERGRAYLASCEQILEDLAAAERRVRGESAEPRGELAVTAPVVFGRLHVLPIVSALLAAHPALRVRLALSDRNVHLVEDGVDAAVRIGELPDSSLLAVRLGAVHRVVVASPAYLARRGTPATPAGLAAHDRIGFEGLGATDEWRFRAQDAPVRGEPRLVVNTADAAIAAAEAGVGIARTLSYQADAAVRAGRLVRLLPKFEPPALPIHVLSAARRAPSPNVTAFVAAARAAFARSPLRA